MVYASENLSLAALELFVHVSPGSLPVDLIAPCGKLPSSISVAEVHESDLPNNWRQYPAPIELQTIGTDWLTGQRSLVLFVPSAINRLEKNILLNPAPGDQKTPRAERTAVSI